MKNNFNSTLSSYWLEEDDFDVLTGEKEKKGKDLFKLSSYQRAVANFVKIVTGEDINVKFNSKDSSYTDGKTVVIGASTKPGDFDPNVGLALHEASHCILTDFETVKDIANGNISRLINKVSEESINILFNEYKETFPDITFTEFKSKTYTCFGTDILGKIKDLANYVEDRRIDLYMFRNAQGYNGYYSAMYNKYFNNKIIDKALKSSSKRAEDWDSYMFRIINLTNKNRDLNALKGLREIYELIDFSNIGRLKSTAQTLDIAIKIFGIVNKNIEDAKSESQSENNQQNQQDGNGESEQNGSEKIDSENTDQQSGATVPEIELSMNEENKASKALEKQLEFGNGEVKKTTVTKKDSKMLEAIAESGSNSVSVGNDVDRDWGRNKGGVDCIVIENITDSVLDGDLYNNFQPPCKWRKGYGDYAQRGVVLGKLLGKKLKVRNEEKSTVFNRLNNGKIDKRMISGLGYGAENVFYNIETSVYNPATLHISIDGSGSMNGEKFGNTILATVAICQAAKMIQGLDVEVTYRTTESVGSHYKPAIFYLYKSKRDTIRRFVRIVEHIRTNGTTPEGLCFEAIIKNMTSGTTNRDSYFVNFSDGEPWYSESGYEYSGQGAVNHTSKMVKKMKSLGINVLSYFISSGSYQSDRSVNRFKHMYGKDAAFINVGDIAPLAKTLNNMFI